jgi:thiol-disulfide isomerase/thioredoxin
VPVFPPSSAVRRAVAAAVTAVVGVLTVAACGGQIAANTPASSGVNFVSGNGNSAYFTAGSRAAAPAISGATLSGARLSLSSYRGKVVVINFWGSWCAPCRSEAATLEVLSEQYQPKAVQFVGVDIRDSLAGAEAFVQNHAISYPSLNDPADEIALAFRGTVPPAAIPSTLVIDRNGRIAGRVIGQASYSSLGSILAKVTAGA